MSFEILEKYSLKDNPLSEDTFRAKQAELLNAILSNNTNIMSKYFGMNSEMANTVKELVLSYQDRGRSNEVARNHFEYMRTTPKGSDPNVNNSNDNNYYNSMIVASVAHDLKRKTIDNSERSKEIDKKITNLVRKTSLKFLSMEYAVQKPATSRLSAIALSQASIQAMREIVSDNSMAVVRILPLIDRSLPARASVNGKDARWWSNMNSNAAQAMALTVNANMIKGAVIDPELRSFLSDAGVFNRGIPSEAQTILNNIMKSGAICATLMASSRPESPQYKNAYKNMEHAFGLMKKFGETMREYDYLENTNGVKRDEKLFDVVNKQINEFETALVERNTHAGEIFSNLSYDFNTSYGNHNPQAIADVSSLDFQNSVVEPLTRRLLDRAVMSVNTRKSFEFFTEDGEGGNMFGSPALKPSEQWMKKFQYTPEDLQGNKIASILNSRGLARLPDYPAYKLGPIDIPTMSPSMISDLSKGIIKVNGETYKATTTEMNMYFEYQRLQFEKNKFGVEDEFISEPITPSKKNEIMNSLKSQSSRPDIDYFLNAVETTLKDRGVDIRQERDRKIKREEPSYSPAMRM